MWHNNGLACMRQLDSSVSCRLAAMARKRLHKHALSVWVLNLSVSVLDFRFCPCVATNRGYSNMLSCMETLGDVSYRSRAWLVEEVTQYAFVYGKPEKYLPYIPRIPLCGEQKTLAQHALVYGKPGYAPRIPLRGHLAKRGHEACPGVWKT